MSFFFYQRTVHCNFWGFFNYSIFSIGPKYSISLLGQEADISSAIFRRERYISITLLNFCIRLLILTLDVRGGYGHIQSLFAVTFQAFWEKRNPQKSKSTVSWLKKKDSSLNNNKDLKKSRRSIKHTFLSVFKLCLK